MPVRHDAEVCEQFARRLPRESGAAAAWVRCYYVNEFEPGHFNRCLKAEGHPGEHVWGKQELYVELRDNTRPSTPPRPTSG